MAERARGRVGPSESVHHLPRVLSRGEAPAPPAHRPEVALPRGPRDECRITAIGHSAFLLQVGGLNVLTDPVFVDRASPFQWAGPRRLRAPGLARADLPPIDLVLQSHDHYDHLDLHTARWLAQRDPGATWCVPAAHFSGRTPFDRDATLWCGWSLRVAGHRIYFVGDTGFHPEFATIGARLGAWDAILMPVGAYAPRWFMRPVHCDPDDALTAFDALTAPHPTHPTVMLAMHWGTFALSDEPIDEPIATRALRTSR